MRSPLAPSVFVDCTFRFDQLSAVPSVIETRGRSMYSANTRVKIQNLKLKLGSKLERAERTDFAEDYLTLCEHPFGLVEFVLGSPRVEDQFGEQTTFMQIRKQEKFAKRCFGRRNHPVSLCLLHRT